MSEQWEVTFRSISMSPGDEKYGWVVPEVPEGWEPFAMAPASPNGPGIWLRRRVPTQTYVSGEQQSRLNEYPAQVGLQRALTEDERHQRDKAQQAIALRANQPA